MENFEPKTVESLFANGGEMGRIMRDTEWSKTRLGEPARWSPALRMMTKFLLANRFPQLLWWGPQFCSIYNDAYSPILGTKHPWALGQPVSEVWKEIWHILKPLIETPFHGGPATWMEDIPLELNRRGFFEETHFTIAYSPVPDETAPNGIGGVLATVHEITAKVVGERRVHALRDLGAQSAEPKSAEQACSIVGETLSKYPKDIPFLLLYLLDEKHQSVRLACSVPADRTNVACPGSIDLNDERNEPWPFSRVRTEAHIQVVRNLESRFKEVPPGPWADPPRAAAVLPLRSSLQGQLAGFMIVGLSSRIDFDENYRDFLNLISNQVATMIANARSYEEERKRAEALAEIDRAKTLFFSNVSHEFRTPLTLMLGPLEELVTEGRSRLAHEDHQQVEVARRNALRLLKLVNTLLDFSRIEAGRIQAVYEPTDLSRLTADIASSFRSAIEKAGLRFSVECESISEPVYVDRDMWEKVVLNLLSNAFKFTFQGEVVLTLKQVNGFVDLAVRDTGVGIPEEEQGRIFERFHRIENTRARTHEGTGIGLALVQELVRLHGGNVQVSSASGLGTTFLISIPRGTNHLPAERIGARRTLLSTALVPDAFIEEAQRWAPNESPSGTPAVVSMAATAATAPPVMDAQRDLIVVADDNADMRDYVVHLLKDHYTVQAVSNGAEALEATRKLSPALVLADVMMPSLDGFGLVREIRGDGRLQSTPVILLSARAGEESRVEGLEAGADDYLVKPFTARELIARVATHVRMAKLRREAAEREAQLRAEAELERTRLQELLVQAPAAIGLMFGPEHRWVFVNDQYVRVTGRGGPADFLGKTLLESLPEMETQQFVQLLDEVYRTGKPYFGNEMKAVLNRAPGGKPEDAYFDFVYQPLRTASGEVEGVLVHAVEVTAKVHARKDAEQTAERLRLAYSAGQIGAWEWDPVKNTRSLSDELHEMFAIDRSNPDSAQTWASRVHPDDLSMVLEKMEKGHSDGEMEFEYRYLPRQGEVHWFYCKGRRSLGTTQMFGIVQDVTERKRAAEALEQSEKKYREFAETATVALHWVGADGTIIWANQAELDMLGYTAEEYIGQPIAQFHVDAPVIDDILTRLCRGDKLREYEARLRAKDGSIRYAVIDSSVLFENGKFIHTRCFTRDITERKLAEQRLQQSEARLRGIVETTPECVKLVSRDGTLLHMNSAGLSMIGVDCAETVVGKSLYDLVVPEDRERYREFNERICLGEHGTMEFDILGFNGVRRRMETHAAPLRNSDGSVAHLAVSRDITQRKIAEQALRESEQKLRVVTDATPVMIWMAGTDKLCYYFNKSWLDFVGRTLEQEAGNGWAENVHPDDFNRCLEIYVTCFEARQSFEMEYRLRHHTGEYRWILDHGVPRYTPEGTFEGYVGGCLDIHDQKESAEKVRLASEALRKSEERLRALVNATSYVVYRMSPDWSEMWQLDGRGFISDTQEPLNNWIDVYIYPDDQVTVWGAIRRAIATKTAFELEHRVRRVDGSLGWTLSRAVPVLDSRGNIVEWFGAASDITTRKVAEQARRRLAAIVESSHEAIISKDLNGIVTSWNRQAERLFGYKENEMLGRSILTIIPPELHRDEHMILSKIKAGEKIDHFETVRLAKSGERIEVSISISPVRDENGQVVGAAKIARDIRENKKIERTLRTTEKLAAAGRLAATVAHEINNPLEAVANLVFLAKRDLPDAEKVSSHLQSAKQELNRVAHITRQTLGFYRDTSSPVQFNVANTLDDLLGLYERRLETRKIRLVKNYERDAEIVALAGEIRQALSNLLTNALDAMPSGGMLELRIRKCHQWNDARTPGVRIVVADSGSGIGPEHKQNLFQPFFTTKADVGTGLGLWITRGIIEKHGGFIRAKSSIGERHGSTFSIFVPCDTTRNRELSQPRALAENELVAGD